MKQIFALIFCVFGFLTAAQTTAVDPAPANIEVPHCDGFATDVFGALFRSEEELFELFIELNQYQNWVDQVQITPDKKDLMKLNALQNYKSIRKAFKKESKRIHKLFSDFERNGGVLTLDSCGFRPNKDIPTLGVMTCYYSGSISKSSVRDAIWFEVVYDGLRFRVVDGFFEPI